MSRHVICEIEGTPGYRLEVEFRQSRAGTTISFYTVWPGARCPDPHCKLSMTLPPDGLLRLAKLIEAEVAS